MMTPAQATFGVCQGPARGSCQVSPGISFLCIVLASVMVMVMVTSLRRHLPGNAIFSTCFIFLASPVNPATQLFSTALWLLDSYWQYFLFTLFMIASFEATVVMQRLKNLQTLKGMGNDVVNLRVHRAGR